MRMRRAGWLLLLVAVMLLTACGSANEQAGGEALESSSVSGSAAPSGNAGGTAAGVDGGQAGASQGASGDTQAPEGENGAAEADGDRAGSGKSAGETDSGSSAAGGAGESAGNAAMGSGTQADSDGGSAGAGEATPGGTQAGSDGGSAGAGEATPGGTQASGAAGNGGSAAGGSKPAETAKPDASADSSGSATPSPTPQSEENSHNAERQTIVFSVQGNEEWGAIIPAKEMQLEQGDTAISVLKRAAKANKLAYEIRGSGIMAYVAGIDGLFEFDDGPVSGWKFKVNGQDAAIGGGAVELAAGDRLEWYYVSHDEAAAGGA